VTARKKSSWLTNFLDVLFSVFGFFLFLRRMKYNQEKNIRRFFNTLPAPPHAFAFPVSFLLKIKSGTNKVIRTLATPPIPGISAGQPFI
jgi:hypothetical protein